MPNPSLRRFRYRVLRRALPAAALAAATLLQPAASVLAQASAATAEESAYAIPAGPLSRVVSEFAGQAGVVLSFDAASLRGRQSPGLQGSYAVETGFAALLAGSGYQAVRTADGNYVLRVVPAGALLLGPLRVTGMSADFATEGTASYTARAITIGKTPTSLRETPQSVSLITRQRLDDQNFVELTEAMKYVPGVAVRRQSSTGNRSDIYSRGYQASTYQLDGINTHNNPATIEALDLALFDRIEALRGPAGLYSGAGEPGVTINLVRKRARAPFQFQAALGAGSWDRYRAEADVTGALTESGGLRGRLVAVGEDAGSYLKGVDGDKQVAYGTLEYDLSAATTLSVGATWQRSSSFYDTGLPAYANGQLPDIPWDTAIVADWTTADPKSVDGFVELENRLDNGGLFKAALRQQERTQRDFYINNYGPVAADGTTRYTRAQRVARDYDDTSADLYFSTPFEWFGQTHNVLVGADYRASDQLTVLHIGDMNTTVNLFDYNPGAVPPPASLRLDWDNLAEVETYGVYSQLRFKPVDALTLVGGARVSWWQSKAHVRSAGTRSSYEANGEFTPYAAVLFDIGQAFTLYASYADIFQPQSNPKFGGGTLEPRVGEQYEVGIKGEFFDGNLNTSAALFRIDDKNRALADPAHSGFSIAAGKVRSEGFEAEITGELSPRWRLTSGYAYTKTEYLKGTSAQTGQVFSTFTPRHIFNLWTHYQLPEVWLPGLEVGAGLRAVSDSYVQSGAYRWRGAGYAVAALQLGYQIDEHYKLTLNVDNLFDRKYWERVENGLRSNYYGAPRSLMLTLRASY